MRRAAFLAVILAPALAAASVPIEAPRETVAQALARVSGEAEAAEVRVATLTKREQAATDEAAQLRIARQRAAADISLTEARIARADLQLSAARLAVAERATRLDRRRAPLAALLAGLATMGRRPPILALADSGSIRDMVRVRALVDTSMPVIAARSASLKAALSEGQRLAAAAQGARRDVFAARAELVERTRRFAALEARASARAATLRADASGADDRVLAGGEEMLDLRGRAEAAAAARRSALLVAALPLAPPRPFTPDAAAKAPGIRYALPTSAAVVDGFGTVNESGVRSRGIRFATARGSIIIAPAEGTILFAGPFREHDGIIVIDHGRGWTSLLTGVGPTVTRGEHVAAGSPLGRALGDVGLELRDGGQPRSPALIAGSSHLLSNRTKFR